ncbi:MAG: sigma-70 family RNA polymerase sigma factor [Bacteroidia bacterium]|nr:sigma-70 family RNA polymerase sigma factor [Bacteroidia bacterium]
MKIRLPYSDEQIIEGIKARNRHVIRFLYSEYWEKVIRHVTINSGSVIEAEDIFQETIVKAYTEIQKPDFLLSCSFDAYFMSICKNNWIYAVKMKNKRIFIDFFTEEYEDTNLLREYNLERLHKLMWTQYEQLKADCQEVLDMYYLQEKGMNEIAHRMEYRNNQIAMNKKFRCLEYLRGLLRNHPAYNNLVNE